MARRRSSSRRSRYNPGRPSAASNRLFTKLINSLDSCLDMAKKLPEGRQVAPLIERAVDRLIHI